MTAERVSGSGRKVNPGLLRSRSIGTAVGILMAVRKVPSDQAFEALAAASQASHRKLRDVADDVIATGSLPGG